MCTRWGGVRVGVGWEWQWKWRDALDNLSTWAGLCGSVRTARMLSGKASKIREQVRRRGHEKKAGGGSALVRARALRLFKLGWQANVRTTSREQPR